MQWGSIATVGVMLAACDPGVLRVGDDTSPDVVTTADSADASTNDAVDDAVADATLIDGDASDGDDADVPADVEVDTTPPPLPTELASLARVFDGTAERVVTLPNGAWIVGAADGWWWVDAGGAREVTVGDGVEAPIGPPTAAAAVDGVTLVAARDGLWLAADGVLTETPLADVLAGESIVSLAASPLGLWIGTDDQLWRFRADHLTTVAPNGLPNASATLAPGVRSDSPALWIASGPSTFAITDDAASGLLAWPEHSAATTDDEPVDLATDRDGRVWIITRAGAVIARDPVTGAWEAVAMPAPIRGVSADADHADVWLAADDALYHLVGDELRRVTNAPVADALTTGRDGRVLVTSATGIDELAPGRVLAALGLAPGTALTTASSLTLRASDPEHVATIDATLDGAALTLTPVGEGAARTWSVALDPVVIANGDHDVSASATYDDGLALETRVPFTVHFATWDDDVRPVYERRCATCHDAVTGAATAVLDHPDDWSTRIDCILCRVDVPFDRSRPECVACDDVPNSMPPTGALNDTDIERIRDWRAGNFRLE